MPPFTPVLKSYSASERNVQFLCSALWTVECFIGEEDLMEIIVIVEDHEFTMQAASC